MAAENTLSSRGASLEELIALTDEMAALVRAGIPLEEGLTHVARDLARRPGRIAQMLATRMQGGESLLHVVSTSPDVFPPTYRAVVEAGLRCGRLPAALEGLASTAQSSVGARQVEPNGYFIPGIHRAVGVWVVCGVVDLVSTDDPPSVCHDGQIAVQH